MTTALSTDEVAQVDDRAAQGRNKRSRGDGGSAASS